MINAGIILLISGGVLLTLAVMDNLEKDGFEGIIVMLCFAALLIAAGLLLIFKIYIPLYLLVIIIAAMSSCVIYIAAVLFIAVFGLFHKAKSGIRLMIIPGTKLNKCRPSKLLEGRLTAALNYYNTNHCAIIVSGGQVRSETLPEAEAMAQYLIEKTCHSEDIYIENSSVTTFFNFQYSLSILTAAGFSKDETIAVATDLFHFFRCSFLAKKLGYKDLRLVPSVNGSLHTVGWFFREILVLVKLTISGLNSTGK